ncbi:ABC transporter substrate-binding protein, partial [Clostridium polyendosporum]|uniref:ABC transporter substrate-binding protein n=1 Tax=Clostridium polyendosporum TaxID=69208 RepID=UPI001BB36394
ADKAATSSGVKNLKVWVHVTADTDEGKVYAERVKAFNDSQKDVKVDIEFIPRAGGGSGYEDKINTAITTNQLPDIITLDGPNTAAYADAGTIVPITKYISDESKKDYVDSIIQQGTVNNELYSLAAMESTVGLFYNKKVLNELGIKPGTIDNPWTWDDLYAASKKITQAKGVPSLDMALKDKGEWRIYAYAPLLWSNGGDVISQDGLKADGI